MREYRLDELFELQMGKTPSRNNVDYWNNGNNDWISIGDLSGFDKYVGQTKEHLTDLAIIESGIKEIPPNTVVMSFKLSIGKLAITTNKIYSNEAIMAFIDKKIEKISSDYLYYLLLSKDWNEGTNKAVMGKTLNKASLSKFKIKLHEIKEQEEIVAILDRANKLKTLRKRHLDQLDNLIKSRFVEMFGDTVSNSMKWKSRQLQEIGLLQSGGTPSRSNSDYYKGDIDWYSAGELNKLFLDESVEKITQTALEESSAKLFKEGSMLIGMYDTAAFKMGILQKDSASNQACANILPTHDVNIVWLYYNLYYMKDYFLSKRRGIRQKNLNLGMIKEFIIPVPPITLQNHFATFVQQVDKMKVEVQKSLDETQTLMDSLMQKYFG